MIADKLRQEEEAQSGAANGDAPVTPQADALEGTLVSEYARDNYDAAMSFLNSKPDDKVKMMMLLRTLQTLPTAM